MDHRWHSVFLAGSVLLWAGYTGAAELDPTSPQAWRIRQAEECQKTSRWLPARIRQLKTERTVLLKAISTLPQFEPANIPDHVGYHSAYVKQGQSAENHQIVAHFTRMPSVGAVALVPAINPRDRHGGNYAFPKRFTIEALIAADRRADVKERLAGEKRWIEIANWLDEDFPDPGRYPVVFTVKSPGVSKVRMTIPGIESQIGRTFFALSEFMLFKCSRTGIADNMSVWGTNSIAFEVSSTYDLPPVWDSSYMMDGLTGLGTPLSEQRVNKPDFIVRFANEPQKPVRIVLDLGKIQRVGRIELWPTEEPQRVAVPLFGFPGKVSVELSKTPEFAGAEKMIIADTRARMYHDNLLRIICNAHEARYIRLTLDDLHEDDGIRTLGLGEVSVSEHGKVFSTGCDITATGIPQMAVNQLPLLVDGISRGHRILEEAEWILGLAQRRPLDRRLAIVEQELAAARDAWRLVQFRFSIWGGSLLCIGLLAAMILQRMQRRNVLKGLRKRITRDLHDEVGSYLGGISLASAGLEEMTNDQMIKIELGELSLMAREACASLREVVWVTDQETIRLPALLEKLVERVERVLHGTAVILDISSELPDVEVSLTCKRHLIMFFREAVHNCARHANATEVRVGAHVTEDHQLNISVADNGCGFNPEIKSTGWGLDSMRERAEELRGRLDLDSHPDRGTRVRLTLPINTLSHEPTRAYGTSN